MQFLDIRLVSAWCSHYSLILLISEAAKGVKAGILVGSGLRTARMPHGELIAIDQCILIVPLTFPALLIDRS